MRVTNKEEPIKKQNQFYFFYKLYYVMQCDTKWVLKTIAYPHLYYNFSKTDRHEACRNVRPTGFAKLEQTPTKILNSPR